MTNYEKRKAEIEPITRMGRKVAIERNTNKIRSCGGIKCINCLFYDCSNERTCDEVALKWADAEYIEPGVDWTKVPVDTPILVRDNRNNEWLKRYFAKYENGKVYAFYDGRTSWSDDDNWKPFNLINWNYAKLAEVDNE